MDELRLKLAVQKSGRLTDPSLDMLGRCGLKLSRGKDQLMGFGENMPLDVLFVRDDDIPDLVQEDVCDLGLVGLNVIEEKRLELRERGQAARFQQIRVLDFGRYFRRYRHAVRCRRDCASPGPRRPHLRPGLDGIHTAGKPSARSRDRHGESRGHHSYPARPAT